MLTCRSSGYDLHLRGVRRWGTIRADRRHTDTYTHRYDHQAHLQGRKVVPGAREGAFRRGRQLPLRPARACKVVIGPLLEFQPQKNTPPYFNGPYRTAMEHYADFFDHAMQQNLAGTRSVAERDVDDYLIALEAKSLVLGCEELGEGPWYMKHADDHKGDHFLFTDDGELSGVIDWDWCVASGDALRLYLSADM